MRNEACLVVAPELSGWLEKRGTGFVKWAKRFFVLKGTYLYYLKDLTSHQLKGVVPLEHAKVEAAKDQTNASRHLIKIWVSNTFVRVVQQRRYVLSAPTVQIQAAWVTLLWHASIPRPILLAQLHETGRLQALLNSYGIAAATDPMLQLARDASSAAALKQAQEAEEAAVAMPDLGPLAEDGSARQGSIEGDQALQYQQAFPAVAEQGRLGIPQLYTQPSAGQSTLLGLQPPAPDRQGSLAPHKAIAWADHQEPQQHPALVQRTSTLRRLRTSLMGASGRRSRDEGAALPKLDAGFGFLSAPVVEQAAVPQAPVMGSPAQPAQPAIAAAPAQDTRQASLVSRPALPGAPAEPADPQHSPSGLRTAVPEAAVGSGVPAWEPVRVDHDGAPVKEPAWMPCVVDPGGVQQSEAGPGSRAGSQQAAFSGSQELQQRRRAALNRVKSALASPYQQQQVQHAVGSASWPSPADTSRLRRSPSPEGRPGLPGLQVSAQTPAASRSASPQAQGQGLSVGSVLAGGDGRPTAAHQASRRPPGALGWAAGWGRHQLEAGQQAAAQAAPFGQGSPRLQVQPSAYVPPSPREGQGQGQPLAYPPQWQQEEEYQAEGLWRAGPLQGLPEGGLFGWQRSGSPHVLQPPLSPLQQLMTHQAATMQELERAAAVAHAQHQSEQAERSRQRAPFPRSGSPSPASRLLRVAVPGPTAMALQAQQQLLPQLSRRVSDLRKKPGQRRVSLRSQRSGSLQRKSLGQPCQQELQEVPAQTQGSLQMVSEAADQLLQHQQQARAGEQVSEPATGGKGRSQEALGEQQGLPAAGLQDRPVWHQASRSSVQMHLAPSGRSAASIAVADRATHGHSAQLAGAFISERESKQVQAHLRAAAASNQAGEAGQAPAGVQAQGSDSQVDLSRLDGTLAGWCQDRGQSMPVKLRRQDSLQQQKLRLQRQERAMQEVQAQVQQLVQSQQSLLAQVAAHSTAQQTPTPAGVVDARRHQQQLDSLQEQQALLDQQGAAVEALQAEVLQAQREAQASVQATAAQQASLGGQMGQRSTGAAPAWAADRQQAAPGHAAAQGDGGPPCVALHESLSLAQLQEDAQAVLLQQELRQQQQLIAEQREDVEQLQAQLLQAQLLQAQHSGARLAPPAWDGPQEPSQGQQHAADVGEQGTGAGGQPVLEPAGVKAGQPDRQERGWALEAGTGQQAFVDQAPADVPPGEAPASEPGPAGGPHRTASRVRQPPVAAGSIPKQPPLPPKPRGQRPAPAKVSLQGDDAVAREAGHQPAALVGRGRESLAARTARLSVQNSLDAGLAGTSAAAAGGRGEKRMAQQPARSSRTEGLAQPWDISDAGCEEPGSRRLSNSSKAVPGKVAALLQQFDFPQEAEVADVRPRGLSWKPAAPTQARVHSISTSKWRGAGCLSAGRPSSTGTSVGLVKPEAVVPQFLPSRRSGVAPAHEEQQQQHPGRPPRASSGAGSLRPAKAVQRFSLASLGSVLRQRVGPAQHRRASEASAGARGTAEDDGRPAQPSKPRVRSPGGASSSLAGSDLEAQLAAAVQRRAGQLQQRESAGTGAAEHAGQLAAGNTDASPAAAVYGQSGQAARMSGAVQPQGGGASPGRRVGRPAPPAPPPPPGRAANGPLVGSPAQPQRFSAVKALLAAAAASAAVQLSEGQGAGLAAAPALQDIPPEEPGGAQACTVSGRSSVSGAHLLGWGGHRHSGSLPPSLAQHAGRRSSARGKGEMPLQLPLVTEQTPQSLPAVMQPLPLSNLQGRGSSTFRSPEQGQPADQQQQHRRPSMLRASLLRLTSGTGQRASLPGALRSLGSPQHAGLPVARSSLGSSGSPCQPPRDSHTEPASGSTQAWQLPQPAPASEGQPGAPGSASQRAAEDPASGLAGHLPGEQPQAPADQKWIEQQLALLEVVDPALPAQQELHVGRLSARLSAGARSSAAALAILQKSEAQVHSLASWSPAGDALAEPDGSVMPQKAAGEQQLDPSLQQQLLWLQMMMQQGEGLSEEEQTSLQQLWLTQQLQQLSPEEQQSLAALPNSDLNALEEQLLAAAAQDLDPRSSDQGQLQALQELIDSQADGLLPGAEKTRAAQQELMPGPGMSMQQLLAMLDQEQQWQGCCDPQLAARNDSALLDILLTEQNNLSNVVLSNASPDMTPEQLHAMLQPNSNTDLIPADWTQLNSNPLFGSTAAAVCNFS